MTSIIDGSDRTRQRTSPDISRILRHAPLPAPRDLRAQQELAGAVGHLRDALEAMSALRQHLRGMAETLIAASVEKDLGMRALLAEDYEDQLRALPGLIPRRYPAAVVLIGPEATALRVTLPNGGEYVVPPFSPGEGEAVFGLTPPQNSFAVDSEIVEAMRLVEEGFARVDRATVLFAQNSRFLKARMAAATGA